MILPCVCVRACVIEKKLQERFRKVSFADSEKPEIIVKPGQGSPTHREQNLRGLPKAHKRAAPSNAKKSEHIVRTVVAGLNGTRAAREAQGPWQGPMGKLPVGEAPEPELTTEPSPCQQQNCPRVLSCGYQNFTTSGSLVNELNVAVAFLK